jgi:hypothetical protein
MGGQPGDILHLFLALPSTAATSFFFGSVTYSGRSAKRLAEYYRTVDTPPVHWKPRNGLEGCLVGSYGFDVYEYLAVWIALVAAS